MDTNVGSCAGMGCSTSTHHLDDFVVPSSERDTVSVRHPASTSRAKRLVDIVLALSLLVVAAPILAVSVLLIRLTSEGSAIYRSERIGHHGKPFTMYKLRTMTKGADSLEPLMSRTSESAFFKPAQDFRITRVGRFLRRYSIDELPQLLNVIRGEMSIVGPRPLLRHEVRGIRDDFQNARFRVRQGLTGLWQVNGRSSLPDEERMRLDEQYVERWSNILDLAIMMKSIPVVLFGIGAR